MNRDYARWLRSKVAWTIFGLLGCLLFGALSTDNTSTRGHAPAPLED